MSDLHQTFADAFNARDLQALVNLLADDATAEVLGSPFPIEQGPDQIAKTSFPHVLDEQAALRASLGVAEGERWILLRANAGAGPVDTAIRLETKGSSIARVEYVVAPHQPRRLRALGAACGIATAADATG